MMRKRRSPKVIFQFVGKTDSARNICGRAAETLIMLVRRGSNGVTVYDFAGGPPFRLSAYIKQLRDAGLKIETKTEPHDCGSHALYVLHTPIIVLHVD